MSEQRFTIQEASGMYLHLPIFDNGVEMADGDVCILLNEQQATIKQQDIEIKNLNLHIGKLVDGSEISQQLMKEYEKNDKLEAKIESMTEQHKARLDKLIEEIGELQMKNVEQQDTIRKLQDFVGQSDGENAKLRIENKRLEKEVNLLRPTNIEQYEQIQKLQEENEKLRKELGDCEKFRYTTFKRMRDVLDE